MKHDENKDLRSVARIAKVNLSDKSIQCSKNAIIGIHMWGKIDFLTKHCGWHFFLWDNVVGVGYNQFADNNNNSARATKKTKKEAKFTDKTRKQSKKK